MRLNGATDLAWEGLAPWIFSKYAGLQFVDYTKSVKRALRAATDPAWPANYHLCFSRSESNEADCLRVLGVGGTVAVVSSRIRPAKWHGYRVVDGDSHDLRHLDPRSSVVWLRPKGNRAKKDASWFVVR